MMLLTPLLCASFTCLFGSGCLGLVVLRSACVYCFLFAMESVHLFQTKTSSQWDCCSMSEFDKPKSKVVAGHAIPRKVISTQHWQTPLFIQSWSTIVQILLLSSIDGPFCSGHFNPFKSFFLLSIWTVIRLLLVSM